MKSLHLPLLGIAVMLLIASCKKDDVTDSSLQNENNSNPVSVAASIDSASGWMTLNNWDTINQQKFDLYYATIKDDKVTSSAADNGLVLVYMKNNNGSVVRLPFEEKANGHNYYWYYQVSEGNILISCDADNAAQTPNEASGFKSVVLSADELKQLEAKDYTKGKLMTMSYNQVKDIIDSNK